MQNHRVNTTDENAGDRLGLTDRVVAALGRSDVLKKASPLADHNFLQFHHRKNRHGTYDSICPVCFITIASNRDVSKLAALERDHICDEAGLSSDDTWATAPH
jgi:hypothetical protein